MLPDLHLHTYFSADSGCPPESQISRALELGLPEICFTDHMDIGFALPDGKPFTFDPDRYFSELLPLRDACESRLRVGIGVELGLDPAHESEVRAVPQAAPYDYVIGSVHEIDGMDPYYPEYFEKWGEDPGTVRYFETCLSRIRLFCDFDAFGHLDYVLRYRTRPMEGYPDVVFDLIDAVLEELIKKGKALEVNSAGIRKGLGFPNPHAAVIRRYLEKGGRMITVGSDAHAAKDLGADFSVLKALLLSCGVRETVSFRKRRPVFLPLE